MPLTFGLDMNESEMRIDTKIIKRATTSSIQEQHTILIRARIKLVFQGQEPKADKNRREKADVRILELDEGRDEHTHHDDESIC